VYSGGAVTLPQSGGGMDESRVHFRVQELGPAITLVIRIGYLKWLSWLCNRVLKRIHCYNTTVPIIKFVDLGANVLFSNGSYFSSQTIIIF
jgi:hypothetical protein